ncbi:MAG: glycosyltransferase [Candidatus Dojkabacteria bacterium]
MKLLFAPMASSSLAHMARLFAIADEMKDRGHEILFTSSTERKEFIVQSGYEVYSRTYLPVNFNDPKDQSLNYLKAKRDNFKDWFATEIEAAEHFEAQLVISSPGFLGPHVTFKTNIPTLAVINAPYLAESVGVLGLSLTENSLRHQLLRSFIKPKFEKKFTSQYVTQIVEIYKELGIDFYGKNRTQLYECMDIVIPGMYELEPVEPKDAYYYSGPLFWKGFEKNTECSEEMIKDFKGEDTLIYLSFGGSIFNLDFYNHIFELIAKLPYKFLVSTGLNFSLTEFTYNKKNTRVYRFVPGLKACKLSDVVINTGAHGTVMQALRYAKPMICIPCNIDQSFYAYRVEELGLGININKTSITRFAHRESYYKLNPNLDKEIISGISEILTAPKYKHQTMKYSVMLRRQGSGVKNIGNYIESRYGY